MPGSKRICRQCLNDDRYLNNIIASDPDASESCDYCDSDEMTMSMETLAEKVDWLIENYYRGGEYNHYLEEYEGEPLLFWSKRSQPMIISSMTYRNCSRSYGLTGAHMIENMVMSLILLKL